MLMWVYLSHIGLPVCELGKTGRPITRGKARTSGTTRGAGGSRGRKRKKKRKHWSASESDSDWEPWMEVQTTNNGHKTSEWNISSVICTNGMSKDANVLLLCIMCTQSCHGWVWLNSWKCRKLWTEKLWDIHCTMGEWWGIVSLETSMYPTGFSNCGPWSLGRPQTRYGGGSSHWSWLKKKKIWGGGQSFIVENCWCEGLA